MTKMVRALTKEDKGLLAAALLNAGVKARIKKLHIGFRVVFDGSYEAVATALNNEGFLAAGGEPFGRYSALGNQVFVRYAA